MYIYRLVLLLVVGIYLFSPAIMDWWIDATGAWYRPYMLCRADAKWPSP